jgi:hypothetical protein
MSRLAFSLALTSLLASTIPAAASANAPTPVPSTTTTSSDFATAASLRIAPPVVDRARLRARLLENRRANIARFHAYRIAGVYPSNVFTSSVDNIWRDQQGHFCAAATIIRASGELELVDQIAEENNFFRLADVSQGPVMDWILTSGLTQAELVMIQKPTVGIDPKLRAAETRRLASLYRDIERKLLAKQRANLDLAVDRLMRQPHLAQRFLGDSTSS